MAGKLRIIGGTARGRKIFMVPGDSTRPITDRVKESLFNILGSEIAGSYFLDVFAGTGSVGIEALSRGADWVRFLDTHPLAIKTLNRNLELTGFQELSHVMQKDAFSLLAQPPDETFDYIYIAPPQYKEMWVRAIETLDKNPDWLLADGWVVIQIDPKEYKELTLQNLSKFDQRKYGSTLLVFYERVGKTEDDGQ